MDSPRINLSWAAVWRGRAVPLDIRLLDGCDLFRHVFLIWALKAICLPVRSGPTVFHLLPSAGTVTERVAACWTKLVSVINNHLWRASDRAAGWRADATQARWMMELVLTDSIGFLMLSNTAMPSNQFIREQSLKRYRGATGAREKKRWSGKCGSIGPRCCQVTHWLSQQRCKTSSCGCLSIVNDSPGNVLLSSAVSDWVSGLPRKG